MSELPPTPHTPPTPPTPHTSPAPPRKGLSTGAKVGIGCAIAFLLALLVAGAVFIYGAFKAKQWAEGFEKTPVTSMARTYAALNPDIEFVEADEERRIVTFRNKKTGETVTIDAEDLAEGRISFEGAEGRTTIETKEDESGGSFSITGPDGTSTFTSGAASAGDVPAWVIRYPGAEVSGAFSTRSGNQESGTLTFTTGDSLQRVFDHFIKELEGGGYEVEQSSFSGGGREVRILQGQHPSRSRQMSVTISRDENATQAMVQYQQTVE
jgi:hypothetical protein